MIKNLRPLNDQVLIRPIEQEEDRRGSILIANLDSDGPTRLGEVVAIGPGRKSEFGALIEVTVKVGDVVVLPKIGPQRVIVGSEELYTIASKEIIAVVDYIKD